MYILKYYCEKGDISVFKVHCFQLLALQAPTKMRKCRLPARCVLKDIIARKVKWNSCMIAVLVIIARMIL